MSTLNGAAFAAHVGELVARYRAEIAGPHEHLSLLRWQLSRGDALDQRTTFPGHVTTSALVLSRDYEQILMIDHVTIGRWLQPGGHYESAATLAESAAREALEETKVQGLVLHPWHQGGDLPLVIDSHDVPGKASRHEPPHVHHDFQYLFVADAEAPLVAQEDEVHAARWQALPTLAELSTKAYERIKAIIG
jgi:8-oxo-dGTP pyrophosphatase MutT (NUDIX family)